MQIEVLRKKELGRSEERHFAYGSNMDAQQMVQRGAPFTERKRAVLKGYTLKFNKIATGPKAKKGEGKGNVVQDPTGEWNAEGALYTVTREGLDMLDVSEGYPRHYNRKQLEVFLDDGSKVNAWVYIAQPNLIVEGLKPTREYLEHYKKGRDVLSARYYSWLEKLETLD